MTDVESKAMVVAPVSSQMVRLGRRKEIKEYARRIQTQAPGGMKLTPEECLTLAQYSYTLGANALIGEAWLLKNERTGQVLGLMPGYRLYVRRADEKDERTGDARWFEPEIMDDPDERRRYGVPADAFMAIKVRMYRQSQTKPWNEMVSAMAGAGAPWNDIRDIAGAKPFILGISYITAEEQRGFERAGERNKMPPFQRALKRAEVHALKQAYALPFGFVALSDEGSSEVPSGALLEDYIVEGSWKEVEAPPADDRTPEVKAEAAADGAAALFGPERIPPGAPYATPDMGGVPRARSWKSEVIDAVRPEFPPDTAVQHIVAILNLAPLEKDAPPAELARWCHTYQAAHDIPELKSVSQRQAWAVAVFEKQP